MEPTKISISSFSEPPMNSEDGTKGQRVTMADVAMRIARDGLMYAIIALIGVLAFKGIATASESMIALLGTLMAKMWPGAIQVDKSTRMLSTILIIGGVGAVGHLIQGCTPSPVPAYEAGLVTCNKLSNTCEESIKCENKLREANHRPLRDIDAGCK